MKYAPPPRTALTVRPSQARSIVQVGDVVLARPCQPVVAFDDALAELVGDMFASMYAAAGVGLAANQIGVPLRVFVFDCPTGSTRLRGVVVNPRLIDGDTGGRHLVEVTEGCLSIAGQYAVVPRLDQCEVSGVDQHGHPVRFTGSGLLARCFQHETDHLDGRLYVDRLPQRERADVLRAHAITTLAAD
jgi:peptide deformylase